MAATAAIVSAAAAVAGTGASIGSSVAHSRQGSSKMPTAATPGTGDSAALGRAVLPGAKADAAARTGGGMSPDFLANLVGQQAGDPQAGTDVLGDIRKQMGP